jgi:hypothetical protein
MSRRSYIEKLGETAVDRYDTLLEEGVDEMDASRRILLDEYSNLQQEVISFKKEIGASTLINDKELEKVIGNG